MIIEWINEATPEQIKSALAAILLFGMFLGYWIGSWTCWFIYREKIRGD